MKDLSLHTMDIVQNSIRANATDISITLTEFSDNLTLTLSDNGVGMGKTQVDQLKKPFITSHPRKRTGLGIPLLVQAAEKTGGFVQIESQEKVGTTLTACFVSSHVDCKPLGDIATTIALLIHTNPAISFVFRHNRGEKEYSIDGNISFPMEYAQLKQYLVQQEAALYQTD